MAPVISLEWGKDDTVTVIGGFDKQLYAYSDQSWTGVQAIYEHLELKRPPLVEQMSIADEPSKIISLESSIWKNLKLTCQD